MRAEEITEETARRLGDYQGELTDDGFRSWLAELIIPIIGIPALKIACEPFVRAAIWKALKHSSEPNRFDDYSETVRELTQDVWCWAHVKRDAFLKPGTAKFSTRIYERAFIMARGWLTKKRNNRRSCVKRRYDLPTLVDAKRLSIVLDREEQEKAQRESEAKEIQAEMQKVEYEPVLSP
jgi:hypothetical protein